MLRPCESVKRYPKSGVDGKWSSTITSTTILTVWGCETFLSSIYIISIFIKRLDPPWEILWRVTGNTPWIPDHVCLTLIVFDILCSTSTLLNNAKIPSHNANPWPAPSFQPQNYHWQWNRSKQNTAFETCLSNIWPNRLNASRHISWSHQRDQHDK